jgi:putative transposase
VEYPGAVYHVMSRGNRREAIFRDDEDRLRFLGTLGEACRKTGWEVHALCLMPNHFHLVVETPQANLVVGMKWFLGTYTARFNRRHRVVGHLFSGRYKALVVDGSGDGYLRTVCDYVHLNPARARLLEPAQPLRSYRWSSWPEYLKPPGQRWAWLRVDRLLGEYRIARDGATGRRRLEEALEACRATEQGEAYAQIRHGWYLGADGSKEELLAQVSVRAGRYHYGSELRESAAAKAEGIVREELGRLGWTEETLAGRRKGDREKLGIVRRLRAETTVTLGWVAERLRMGKPTSVAHLLYWARRKGGKHNTID